MSPVTRSKPTPAASQIQRYLQAQPPRARVALRRMRDAIRTAAPDAEESFSYRMPGFKLDGKALVWYAGFQEHTSLYPITGAIQRAFAERLKRLGRSTGTVRFPLDRPLPVALIRQLVKARIAEVRGESGGKR
jgi:uncharacterized protein YdhG (YjbR/CyaY superfamily)